MSFKESFSPFQIARSFLGEGPQADGIVASSVYQSGGGYLPSFWRAESSTGIGAVPFNPGGYQRPSTILAGNETVGEGPVMDVQRAYPAG